MSDFDLKEAARKAQQRLAAMTPEEQQRHWDAQKASFVRGMTTPCEHGMLDFEDCEQCRKRALDYKQGSVVIAPDQDEDFAP